MTKRKKQNPAADAAREKFASMIRSAFSNARADRDQATEILLADVRRQAEDSVIRLLLRKAVRRAILDEARRRKQALEAGQPQNTDEEKNDPPGLFAYPLGEASKFLCEATSGDVADEAAFHDLLVRTNAIQAQWFANIGQYLGRGDQVQDHWTPEELLDLRNQIKDEFDQ